MLGGDCRKFLNDELGGGTVMGLLWFILLVGITGLAVDTINGFRTRTMLQATSDADADSAALAGVIDLPNEAMAVASAVAYSAGNMPATLYGSVLKAGAPDE
jgi:Flp pilus assembly protein TadG